MESTQYPVSLSLLFLSVNVYFVLSLSILAPFASDTHKERKLPTVPLITFYMFNHSKRLFLNSKYTFLNYGIWKVLAQGTNDSLINGTSVYLCVCVCTTH